MVSIPEMHGRMKKNPSVFRNRKFWIPFVVGAVLGPLCYIDAFGAADFGYGSYREFKVMFPYMMLPVLILGHIPMAIAVISFFQLPLYGVILGVAWAKGWYKVPVVLATIHVLASVLALTLVPWR